MQLGGKLFAAVGPLQAAVGYAEQLRALRVPASMLSMELANVQARTRFKLGGGSPRLPWLHSRHQSDSGTEDVNSPSTFFHALFKNPFVCSTILVSPHAVQVSKAFRDVRIIFLQRLSSIRKRRPSVEVEEDELVGLEATGPADDDRRP